MKRCASTCRSRSGRGGRMRPGRARPATIVPVAEHRVTPLVEELTPVPDPARCCEQLAGLPYRVFLDSASTTTRLGRYSFLTADPIDVLERKGSSRALDEVRARLAPFAAESIAGLPPFQGGAAGYIAYDWGLTLERLPAPRFDDLALPDVVLGIYDWVLAWDHVTSRAWLISTGMPETSDAARADRARQRANDVRARLENAVPSHPRTFAPSHP